MNFLNQTVGDKLKQPQLRPPDKVGIEIEMESDKPFPGGEETEKKWRRDRDGSLRGRHSLEYILARPMQKKGAVHAISLLSRALEKAGTKITGSVREGVHVHINVRDLTFRQLWTLVTCWYVIEDLVTETLCGEGRVGNHFCLRLSDADVGLQRVLSVVSGEEGLGALRDDLLRYSALNFVSLFRHGTLEFRAMRTPRDINKIKDWAALLLALKTNSKDYDNPASVVTYFSAGGERAFLEHLLGKNRADIIINTAGDGWGSELRKGARLAQELAFAVPDWHKETEEPETAIVPVVPIFVNIEAIHDALQDL